MRQSLALALRDLEGWQYSLKIPFKFQINDMQCDEVGNFFIDQSKHQKQKKAVPDEPKTEYNSGSSLMAYAPVWGQGPK